MGETVLIVDDEPDIVEILKEAFEYDGYTVVTALDGAAALEQLREASESPCAAVLDMMMPKMDGGALYSANEERPTLRAGSRHFLHVRALAGATGYHRDEKAD